MFRDRIFSLFDKRDGILVFPTENNARYFLGEYARERRCSVLASSAMAFDSFAELFRDHDGTLQKATRFHHLAFASSFMEKHSEKLSYFYNSAYPESRSRFIPFIVSLLPELKIRDRGRIRNRALLHDTDLIYDYYCRFLSEHNLYEPGFEEYSVPENLPSERFYLIGYDAEIPMQHLASELGPVDFIVKVCSEMEIAHRFSLYENENAELLSIFDKICDLRAEGVNEEDIILSSPDSQRLRPYIERIADERGVKVSFVNTSSLEKTLPGTFLTLVENIYSEEFSFDSLERLLLNSALPYTEDKRALNRALITFMIDNNIVSGSRVFGRDDKLFYALGEKKRNAEEDAKLRLLKEHYGAIKSGVVNLSTACDGKAAAKAIHGLATYLFSAEEFLSSDEYDDRAVFSFILDQMNSFSNTVAKLGLKMESFFSLFMSELGRIPYVSQNSSEGIKIYSYTQDYLFDCSYHFVFALSDKNTRVTRRENSFLEDYELDDTSVVDVTLPLLSYYQGVSRNVFLSGSQETYAGAASAPQAFEGASLVDKVLYAGSPGYEMLMHRKSFAQAEKVAFSRNGALHDIGMSLRYSYPEDEIVISYSTLDSYMTCPFMTAIGALTDMSDNRDVFQPAFMDHRKIGIFLHNVVQNFLKKHTGRMLVESEKDIYKEEIMEEFSLQLESAHFDSYTALYLKSAYSSSMASFIDETLEKLPSFIFREEETRLEVRFVEGGYILKGFADTIAESQGDVVIIDYKKGDAMSNSSTYQLLLYRKLLKEKQGKDADILLYFSFKNGTYIKSVDDEESEEKLEEDIAATVSGFKEGVWSYTAERSNCSGCEIRSICRRRFFIQ